jgi:hypothetical protein
MFNVMGAGAEDPGRAALAQLGASTLTVAPGATSDNTSTVTATPTATGLTCVPPQQCGFTGEIKLSCSVVGTGSLDCSIPSSPTITGTTAETATLTITTTTSSSALDRRWKTLLATTVFTLGAVLWVGFPIHRCSRRTRIGLFIVILFIGMGCGSGVDDSSSPKDSGAMPGTYEVIVTGTASGGKLAGSAFVTVTVP